MVRATRRSLRCSASSMRRALRAGFRRPKSLHAILCANRIGSTKVLSNELEYCLNNAFHEAREARHEYLTVEHLLLAILDTPKVREVLKACGADLAKLKQELKEHLEQSTPKLEEAEDNEVQPTLGFQRVLQRAVFHVQSSGKKEVGVGNVLVAIFSEKQSHAVYLLNRQNVSRLDVVNYLSHGLSKIAEEKTDKEETTTDGERDAEGSGSSLEKYAANLNRMAQEGRIDPLIGRKLEVERTIEILCRRARTIRSTSARPAWARPPSPKGWRA